MQDSTKTTPPILLVLSGPSGVGKDTVLSRMKDLEKGYHFTTTMTTREKRIGEVDGEDYIFLTKKKFEETLANGGFIEWALVYGNLYGVPRKQVVRALSDGVSVIVKIDVQGARTLKKIAPEAIFVFLAPPSMASLEKRLRERETESPEALGARLAIAQSEMEESRWFDHIVVNEENASEGAVEKIRRIAFEKRLSNKVTNYFSGPS